MANGLIRTNWQVKHILVNELHVLLQLIIKGNIWRVKNWRKAFSSPNSPSYSPLQNFPLYGTILKYYPGIIGSGLYVASYASGIHLLQMSWLEIMTLF